MIPELWVKIDGYDGYYQISTFGRVMSFKNKKGKPLRILKPNPDRKGYLTVQLWANKKKKTLKIHRLVAITFIPNPSKYPQVNHENADKACNFWWNLKWCSNEYNIQHAKENNLLKPVHGIDIHTCKLSEEKVMEIFNSNENQNILAKQYKVSTHAIHAIKSGKSWNRLTGKKYSKAKRLSAKQVIYIFKSKRSMTSLAIKFKISIATASLIKSRKLHAKTTALY